MLISLPSGGLQRGAFAEPFGTGLLERGRQFLLLDPIPLLLKLAPALFLSLAGNGQALASTGLVDDAPGETESVPPSSPLRLLATLGARCIRPFRVARPSLGTSHALVQAHWFISLLSLGGLPPSPEFTPLTTHCWLVLLYRSRADENGIRLLFCILSGLNAMPTSPHLLSGSLTTVELSLVGRNCRPAAFKHAGCGCPPTNFNWGC